LPCPMRTPHLGSPVLRQALPLPPLTLNRKFPTAPGNCHDAHISRFERPSQGGQLRSPCGSPYGSIRREVFSWDEDVTSPLFWVARGMSPWIVFFFFCGSCAAVKCPCTHPFHQVSFRGQSSCIRAPFFPPHRLNALGEPTPQLFWLCKKRVCSDFLDNWLALSSLISFFLCF